MLNKNKIAKFVKESVEWLQKEQMGCCTYELDNHLAICVGWSSGYGEEKRYDVIQAKASPDWGINAGIKVWTSDSLRTEYDYINFPYRENEDVLDMECAISPQEDWDRVTEYLLGMYDEVKYLRLTDNGEIFGIKLNDELHEVLCKNDWYVDYQDDGTIYFSKYSPAGQDFGFEVEGTSLEKLADNIYDYYEGYDVSYEAYLWLDDTGHGTNGAPDDMKDVYEDMEACKESILELYELIKEATK